MPLNSNEAAVKASVFFEVLAEYQGPAKLELKDFEFQAPDATWIGGLKPGKLVTVVLKEEGQYVKVSLKGPTKKGAPQIKSVGRVKRFVAAKPAAGGASAGPGIGSHKGGH
jgi:hypothetical protein